MVNAFLCPNNSKQNDAFNKNIYNNPVHCSTEYKEKVYLYFLIASASKIDPWTLHWEPDI